MNMDTASASMVMAHFSTNDSMSQVVDFYKGKMGDGAVAVSTGNGTVFNRAGRNRSDHGYGGTGRQRRYRQDDHRDHAHEEEKKLASRFAVAAAQAGWAGVSSSRAPRDFSSQATC